MSDEKQPMPAQPATKEISAPTQESILLAELRVGLRQLNARFDEVDGRLDSLETTQKILLDDGKSTRDRLVRVELRQDEMQDWRLRSSERVKNVDAKTSEVDLKHDAAIGSLVADVSTLKEQLTKNTALTEEIKALLANPVVKKMGYAAATLAIAALTYATAYLQARGHQ